MDYAEMAREHFEKAHLANMGTVEQDTAVKFAALCAQMAVIERLDKLILLIEHPLREVKAEVDHD